MYLSYLRGGQKPIRNELPRQPEVGQAGREQEMTLRGVTEPVPRARHTVLGSGETGEAEKVTAVMALPPRTTVRHWRLR